MSWLEFSDFMVTGLVSGLSLASHSDSGSFLVAHTLPSQNGFQQGGFWEVSRTSRISFWPFLNLKIGFLKYKLEFIGKKLVKLYFDSRMAPLRCLYLKKFFLEKEILKTLCILLIWRILRFDYLGIILESCFIKSQDLHICANAFLTLLGKTKLPKTQTSLMSPSVSIPCLQVTSSWCVVSAILYTLFLFHIGLFSSKLHRHYVFLSMTTSKCISKRLGLLKM